MGLMRDPLLLATYMRHESYTFARTSGSVQR